MNSRRLPFAVISDWLKIGKKCILNRQKNLCESFIVGRDEKSLEKNVNSLKTFIFLKGNFNL